MKRLGIDIGGTGIKGAPVNLATGELQTERRRIPTPQPSTPEAVAEVVAEICRFFEWEGPVGCGFPAPILNGAAKTAANVDAGWIDAPGEAIIARATGLPVKLINDADAAGLAEVRFGAGKGQKGVVILITIGTGLGSALFVDGILVPNTEFGHMKIRGRDAEVWASEAAREREEMSWKKWARHFNRFISELDKLFWPELFILGGGGSNKHDKFLHLLTANARIVPAQLLNDAGIVGAALAAQDIEQ